LNDSQVEAVAQAYAVDLMHLIQGPLALANMDARSPGEALVEDVSVFW